MMQTYQSEAISELTAAIVKAQRHLKPVPKKCTNPYFKSKYADLSAVWEALAPFLAEGIAITQSPMPAEAGQIALDTQLTHVSGQWMRSRLVMPLAKQDPQAVGSAMTYARRYALGCMTGLVTEEDDDGNSGTHYQNRQEDGVQETPAVEHTRATQQVSDAPAFIWRWGPKWKGKSITEIDDGFLQFALNNERCFMDHREAAQMELDRRQAQAAFEMDAPEE